MNLRMVRALVLKDLRLYFSNSFFALVTVAGLIAYIALYFAMPATVDETLQIGLVGLELPSAIREQLTDEGIVVRGFADAGALQTAVIADEVAVGYVLPDNLAQLIAAQAVVPATLYLSADLPNEYRALYEVFIDEVISALGGNNLPMTVEQQVVGRDMAGTPVTPQQRLRPVLAVAVLLVECVGLASLITAEIENGTMRALLVTRLTVRDIFVGKGLFGTLFAFAQTALLMGLTGGFSHEPLLVAAALLAGSLLVTGVAFLVGAIGRDLLSVMAWGMLALVVLALPLINLAIPGLTSRWVEIIPSYYLITMIHRSLTFGEGWAELGGHLAALVGSALILFIAGAMVLARRFR